MECFHFAPGDWSDAGPQGLAGRFFGGEAHCQGFGTTAAFEYFQIGEDAFQEAFAVPVQGGLDARDFDQIDSGFQQHDYGPAMATAS
jgi:hypothetical protein